MQTRQHERCANVNNFSKALDISKEMEELCNKKRKYQEELAIFQKEECLTNRVKKCLDKKGKATKTTDSNMQAFFMMKNTSVNSENASRTPRKESNNSCDTLQSKHNPSGSVQCSDQKGTNQVNQVSDTESKAMEHCSYKPLAVRTRIVTTETPRMPSGETKRLPQKNQETVPDSTLQDDMRHTMEMDRSTVTTECPGEDF